MISQIVDLGFRFPLVLCCLMAKRYKKIHYWQSYSFRTLSGGEFDYVSLDFVDCPTSHQTFSTFLPGYQEPGLDEFHGKNIFTYPDSGTWRVGLQFYPANILTTFMDDLAWELDIERHQLPPWWQISDYLFDSFTVPTAPGERDFGWLGSRRFSDSFWLYLLKRSRPFMNDPFLYDPLVDNALRYTDLYVGILPGQNGWHEPYSTFRSKVFIQANEPEFPKILQPVANRLHARIIPCGECCDCCCDCE